jgi:hypothetical protein
VNVKIDYKNYDFRSSEDIKTKIRRNIKEKLCSNEQNLQCAIPLFKVNRFCEILKYSVEWYSYVEGDSHDYSHH